MFCKEKNSVNMHGCEMEKVNWYYYLTLKTKTVVFLGCFKRSTGFFYKTRFSCRH